MTENQLRNLYVNTAKKYVGYNEEDGSHKVIIDLYNTIDPLPRGYKVQYDDEWCATFVSAIAQECKLTDIIFPECSCNRMIDKFVNAGRWMENDAYVPKIGDLIMYDWEDSGSGENKNRANHVGLIASVSGKTIKVLEGNKGNAVSYRTKTVNSRYIRGYCLPDYAGAADEATLPTEDKPVSPHDINYIVKKGDTLWGIAGKFGVGLQELVRANPQIRNPNLIYAGDRVVIP